MEYDTKHSEHPSDSDSNSTCDDDMGWFKCRSTAPSECLRHGFTAGANIFSEVPRDPRMWLLVTGIHPQDGKPKALFDPKLFALRSSPTETETQTLPNLRDVLKKSLIISPRAKQSHAFLSRLGLHNHM